MPANKKYLTQSKRQRFAKITAAVLGGYLVSMSVHLALAQWFDRATILITATFTGFILWVICMILAFLAHNGWKIWGIYLLLSSVFMAFTYISKI